MNSLINVDGSFGEAGGQIIRTAIGLSAVTGKPCKIVNIRKNRPNPGLRAQHLKGIIAVKDLCNGELVGGEIGSTEIIFTPGEIESKKLDVRIETAGSIGLVLQTLTVACIGVEKPIEIDIIGGATFGKFAPPLPYTKSVLAPVIGKMGMNLDIEIIKHGFYPRGGARGRVRISSAPKLEPIVLKEQGVLETTHIWSVASDFLKKARVAERQSMEAKKLVSGKNHYLYGNNEYVTSDCPGSGIVLWVKTDKDCILGSDSLGELGKPAEKVGKEATDCLLKIIESKSTVDKYLSDQLLPFMALASGKSEIIAPELTGHAKTNMEIIKKFLDVKFEIKKQEKNVRIECSGF